MKFWLKIISTTSIWKGGSEGKGIYSQVWYPKFDVQDPHGERKELAPTNCLPSTRVPCTAHASTHTNK